jgi:hypothetical protein
MNTQQGIQRKANSIRDLQSAGTLHAAGIRAGDARRVNQRATAWLRARGLIQPFRRTIKP